MWMLVLEVWGPRETLAYGKKGTPWPLTGSVGNVDGDASDTVALAGSSTVSAGAVGL